MRFAVIQAGSVINVIEALVVTLEGFDLSRASDRRDPAGRF